MLGHAHPVASEPVYHVITPGDHYSPRTGSALPTVVHGLATGAEQCGAIARWPQHVLVQADTWADRYPSATPLEYAGGPPPSRRERAVDAAVARLGFRRPFASRAYRPVAERLRSAAPGVVLAHNGAALVRLMSGRTAHRLILYAHNDLFRSFSAREAARTASACSAVVCVSDYLRASMSARVPYALRDRFHTVRNGVDTAHFSPADRAYRWGALRVGFVGRMIPDKGADLLAKAAAGLSRDDIEFTFIGSHGFDPSAVISDYEASVRRIAEVAPCVRFVPFTDRAHLPDRLRDIDVLVVPSRWAEPWALTVGEGLATGVAVVATRVGGIPEQLGDAGILIEPDDATALSRVLSQLADDPVRVRELGLQARRRALATDWADAWRTLAAVLTTSDQAES